ncbi:MFS transporter [Pseudonocardia bannensis]|uniref:MFS transporter n=1 Tax=Pseudonocardia bannensis TaxID=630973 RepID=A0A848DJ80_9PSEU|nr:MFS transporter [Pseudonocardia bannensis]NMH92586.1 MFS transporter [Pseudonocardia bannensis]
MSEPLRSHPGPPDAAVPPRVPYKPLWAVLLLGWLVSYADRTVTGPVIAWMIQNKAGFIGDSANPATLGGLIGSLFFVGYMLTQYPGGKLGDRFGHREMIVVSLLWAGVMTIVSGLVAGLIAFVAARVLTGLGEGVFYSNDRTLVMAHTPVQKRTLGLGVVITGLSIGLTVGIVATPLLIDWGRSLGMGEEAWRVPFYVLGAVTLVVAALAAWFFRNRLGGPLRLRAPFLRLIAYSAPTFAAVLTLFWVADRLGWPEWATAGVALLLAGVYIAVIVRNEIRAGRASTLLSRDALLMYIGFIAVLWNLWFFSFWSVLIVRETAQSSLTAAALTAAFNAVAGIIGFPAGGWLADRRVRRGKGRKPLLIGLTLGYAVLVVLFGLSVMRGEQPSLLVLGLLLFSSGVLFNALQPVQHGMTGDLVPPDQRGSMFGLFNLIAEVGAVASPVVSGLLRDATGSWAPGVFVAAALMFASAVLYALVREKMPAPA